jgi:hypothetical protein
MNENLRKLKNESEANIQVLENELEGYKNSHV